MNDAATGLENKIDPTTDALMRNEEISILIVLFYILYYYLNNGLDEWPFCFFACAPSLFAKYFVWKYTNNTIQIFMHAQDCFSLGKMYRFLT